MEEITSKTKKTGKSQNNKKENDVFDLIRNICHTQGKEQC